MKPELREYKTLKNRQKNYRVKGLHFDDVENKEVSKGRNGSNTEV